MRAPTVPLFLGLSPSRVCGSAIVVSLLPRRALEAGVAGAEGGASRAFQGAIRSGTVPEQMTRKPSSPKPPNRGAAGRVVVFGEVLCDLFAPETFESFRI